MKLGVNIDHVATLRQVRKTTYPSLIEAARACESAGAHGITIHLREDRRHIQDKDVFELRKTLKRKMNLEMANTSEIVGIALKICPDEVCIVPEKRQELTTEGGLNVARSMNELTATARMMKGAGIVVSLFIEPERRQIRAAARAGAPCIELHTGTYCDAQGIEQRRQLRRLKEAAAYAHSLGLQVNAGHGLNLHNIAGIMEVPYLDTLHIGHSIVSRAVLVGMRKAVKEMLAAVSRYKRSKRE